MVIDALVTFDGDGVVSFLIDDWIDWNVENLMLSVVLGGCSSFNLIVVDTFLSMMFPNVVVKPPAFAEYFSVVDVLRVAGRFVANLWVVVVINSKVLLL